MPGKHKDDQKQLVVWVEEGLYYSVFRASDGQTSVSEFVREALREKLEKEKADQPAAPAR